MGKIGGISLRFLEKTKTNTLTAAEVSALWLQYMGDSMAVFSKHC